MGRYGRGALVAIVAAGLLAAPGGRSLAAAAPVAAAPVAVSGVSRPVPYVLPESSKPLHGRKTDLRDALGQKWRPEAPAGGWSKAGPAPSRTKVASPAAIAAGHVGVTDLFAAPGDVIGDTAWVV
jgi:hypothetical protein